MDVFTKLFGEFLVFVYHCFDRIVIHGYLTALSRPELVVHFFRDIVGVAEVSKEALSQRTNDYQRWVEAYARNHSIPIEWAEKGVRKEDHVLPWLNRMARRDAYGVYFIFKSMEQGPTYRISLPNYPSKDPHYRILAHQRSRFTHYYFYIRDEVLGPMVLLVASFFPFRTTYYLNGHSFIEQELKRAGIGFRKHDNAFLAVADPAALQAAADRLSPDIIRRRLDYWTLILGPKFSKKERAQINLSRLYAISQIEYCRRRPLSRPQDPRGARRALVRGCTAALRSVAGRPGKSTTPSAPPLISQKRPMVSTSCATTCASSKAMASSSATAHAMPTASRKKASRWRCFSCSSTSASADRSPIVASTTGQPRNTAPIAASKSPITAPMPQSNGSSIFSRPLKSAPASAPLSDSSNQ